MTIEQLNAQNFSHNREETTFEVNLGSFKDVYVSIYNPDEEQITEALINTLEYIKANSSDIHKDCRKLMFDYVQEAANAECSEYELDVGDDWDLLETLEDGESNELIETYIKLDRIEFSDSAGNGCLIHYEVAWDTDHGMFLQFKGESLRLL